jgi:serine/threonine protein phosphatase 1
MIRLFRKRPEKETTPLAPREFRVPANMRVYAVGDIHGKAALLKKLLALIAEDAKAHAGAKIEEVFLGDYVDRGMQSREVIDLLLEAPPAGHQRIFLKGNHEEALLRFLVEPMVLREWATFGGYATLASYGIQIPQSMQPSALAQVRDRFRENIPTAHVHFLKNLRFTHGVGDYLFVHAGIDPKVTVSEQDPSRLLWIREPFLSHSGYFEQYVVHGHTPVAQPDIRNNRANLDVSAAPKNSLCALVITENERRTLLVTE